VFLFKGDRLSRVEYASRAESTPLLSFHMGKNTRGRKDYFMERLFVLAKK
jgi:hypothetical protein